MRFLRRAVLALMVGFSLCACQTNDLMEPPVPLGDFAMGLNIAVADNMQKSPISRDATADEWKAALTKAMADRFGRYEGTKLYNFGISIDGFALAPPGVPLVLKPKSVLVISANIWDDAAQKKLNAEGKQLVIFEKMSGETVVGSGLTQTKEKQMEILAYNAAKAVEGWLLDNPEWFGLPPKGSVTAKPAATQTTTGAPAAAVPATPSAVTTTPLPAAVATN